MTVAPTSAARNAILFLSRQDMCTIGSTPSDKAMAATAIESTEPRAA